MRKVHLVRAKGSWDRAPRRGPVSDAVSPLRVEERQGWHHAASRAVRCEFHRDTRPALRPALRALSRKSKRHSVSKADDLRDANYWHERAEEARVMADHQDDVVAKSQMIDMADKYDMMAERTSVRARPYRPLPRG
jgi:hypothetical protein